MKPFSPRSPIFGFGSCACGFGRWFDVFGSHGQHTQLGNAAETAAWYRRCQREVIDFSRARSQPPAAGKTPEQLRAESRLIPDGRGNSPAT